MRPTVIWLISLVALAAAEFAEEHWAEEEELEEPYSKRDELHNRRRRDTYVEEPYEEHVRVKRRCDHEREHRERRSAEYTRVPRQVHQYEVHEFSDDMAPASPPYEEMLAASADHYHRYAVPAQASARYVNPEVSGVPTPVNVNPNVVVSHPLQYVTSANPAFVPKPVYNQHVQFVAPPNAVVAPVSVNQAAPVGPVAVAVEPFAPLKQLAEGDQHGSAAGHHHNHQKHAHQHGHQQGGGHHRDAKHFNEHGGKEVKGFKSDHHVDKGGKGSKTDELHRKEFEEAAGKKSKHHDHAGHKGSHEEEAHGHRGAKFDEKKGHKKGHKTKGYHNKYHKDEFHKEHKFYDDYHKSGEHHRYGKFNAKHASNESGKKKAHHVNAGHDYVERGKKGYSNKGHVDADHKGHRGKDGHEEHHQHQSQHGKKGGKEGGSHWGYAKKN